MLAPKASLILDKDGDYKGSFAAKVIHVGKNSTFCREDTLVQPVEPNFVFVDSDGAAFPVNQLRLRLIEGATTSELDKLTGRPP
jgi:hypothetical protein